MIGSSLGLILGKLYFSLIACTIGMKSGRVGNKITSNWDSFIKHFSFNRGLNNTNEVAKNLLNFERVL